MEILLLCQDGGKAVLPGKMMWGWMDSNKSVLRLMEKKKTQKTSKRNEVWQGSGANRRAAL